MKNRTPRESLIEATHLVRRKMWKESLPLLDYAISDTQLTYAPMVRKYAQMMLAGCDMTEVVFEGKRFQFSLGSANLGLEIHHADGRFFEAAELSAIRACVPQRSVVVDVGANVGNHVVFFAAMLAPALVIPVEPVPEAVSALRRNLALNHIKVDERGFGIAAGRENGWLTIELAAMRDLVEARVGEVTHGEQAGTIRSIRLDELVSERVDFLKIDVEGFESNVIIGAERILREDKPLLMVEANDEKRAPLLEQLKALYYKPFAAFPGIGYQNILLRVQV
jgi:FkbM family methyltransferase